MPPGPLPDSYAKASGCLGLAMPAHPPATGCEGGRLLHLLDVTAFVRALCSVEVVTNPLPLQAFFPLQSFCALLQELLPLQSLAARHFTFAGCEEPEPSWAITEWASNIRPTAVCQNRSRNCSLVHRNLLGLIVWADTSIGRFTSVRH